MYMAQDGERVKMNDDIVEQLREEGFVTHMARLPRESKILHAAADEIERLRRNTGCARNQRSTQFCAEALDAQREIERLRNERDEARRMYLASACSEDEIIHEMKRHGWDCFKEDGK